MTRETVMILDDILHISDELNESEKKEISSVAWGNLGTKNDGWVPIGERLPELHDDKSSDCYFITNGIFIWMGYLNFDKEWVFAECTNAKRVIDWIEITAWQPLPEPYKGAKE